MNKRFLKNNFWLVVVTSACGVIALGLLIFTLVEYVEMYNYITKVEDIRQQIDKIIRQKPAPVNGNKPLLQQDIELYRKVAGDLRSYFGHPMQPALDKFFSTLKIRKGEGGFPEDTVEPISQARFLEEFHQGWDSIDAADYPRKKYFLTYEFQPKKFVNWTQARAEFIKAAQPYTLEPITTDNADDILLSALGVPRRLSGDNKQLMDVISEVRGQLFRELGERVQIAGNASWFGLGISGRENAAQDMQMTNFRPDDFPVILTHIDTVSDILRRSKESGIKMVYNVNIRRGGESGSGDGNAADAGAMDSSADFQSGVESVGAYKLYHYQFEVSGSLDSIRNFVKILDNSLGDRRVYLVRSIFLYAEKNGAATNIFGAVSKEENSIDAGGNANEGQAQQQTSRRSRRRRRAEIADASEAQSDGEMERKRKFEEALRRYKEQQARLPFERRDGYGDVLVGGEETCRALIDVEYVALSER